MNLVLHTVDGHVHTLTLNQPDRRNALSWPMLDQFADGVAAVAADTSASALIIAGSGTAFCAGADLEGIFGTPPTTPPARREYLQQVYSRFLGIRDLAIPTIAAVDGPAVGAGLNIALACDYIVASPKARFIPSFVEIGLHPGGGCSFFLVERIGPHRAIAALLLGKPITAEEAFRMGLIEELVDADAAGERAGQIAAIFASRSTDLVRSIKRSVMVAQQADLTTSTQFESWAQAESLDSKTFRRFLVNAAKGT